MNIEQTRGYGIAASDAEENWDITLKKRLKKDAFRTIMKQISFWQKIRLLFLFNSEKKRAATIDLSEIQAKGMRNENFIKQQLEYISLFSTLVKIFGKERALKIMFTVMDKTADALITSLPEVEDVKKFGDPVDFFSKYIAVFPDVSKKAGCHEITTVENSNSFQFYIHYCVWFELAKKMGVPDACLPNCYADDLVYPGYFKSLGIKYSRTGTLAQGKKCCDFRFERI